MKLGSTNVQTEWYMSVLSLGIIVFKTRIEGLGFFNRPCNGVNVVSEKIGVINPYKISVQNECLVIVLSSVFYSTLD